MRCRTAERLLHLYREDELDPDQNEALARHLLTCDVCRERAEVIRSGLERLESARRQATLPEVPAGLKESVLRRTVAQGAPRRTARRPYREYGLLPLLRPVPALLGLLLLGVLAWQEFTLLDRLADLENRLEQAGDRATVGTLGRGLEPALGWGLDRIESAVRLFESTASVGSGTELVVVRRSDLEALQGALRRLTGPAMTLPPEVVRLFPELGAVRLDDGLDRDELDLLLTRRPELLHLLRTL